MSEIDELRKQIKEMNSEIVKLKGRVQILEDILEDYPSDVVAPPS
jgi:uncharacterized coiled-coil DUF342 family protein